MRSLFVLTLMTLFARGHVLPTVAWPLDEQGTWPLPGTIGYPLKTGSLRTVPVTIPELGDKEKDAGGTWRLIASTDLYGVTASGTCEVTLEAADPATGEAFATATTTLKHPAPRATWSVISSSEHPGEEAKLAFDGNPKTIWHSRYAGGRVDGPHIIGVEFGKAPLLTGIRYTPREGFANGNARDFRLEYRSKGQWREAAAGTVQKGKETQPMEILFPEKIAVEAIRMTILSDITGGGFGACAELTPLGITWPQPLEKSIPAKHRVAVEIPADLLTKLTGKRFLLRARAKGATAVLGGIDLARIHTAPSPKLYGRSNGGVGPDQLGAGLLGFDALTEHQQKVLTLMTVRENSPAATAGLVAGDAILSVSGVPLPENDLRPGWEWLHFSHEAMLGRATEAALRHNKSELVLGVLRDGKETPVTLKLPRTRAFTTMDPAKDPEAAALLADMLAYAKKNQKENGSWSNDIIRTTWSALALIATRDAAHKESVKRAVDWSLAKYPKPENYGNLGFWSGAYAGILYSEWFLATGDERVLPHLDALRDWAFHGKHQSAWNVPALGHGPDGLPYEQKALVAPACHLLVFEALAMRCGMKSALWEMLMPYMEMAWSDPKQGGHGSLGYNRSYKDTEEFWSRSGLFAMAANLRGERPDMRDAMTAFMEKNHPWLRNTHAYGEPGAGWGLLALHLARPQAFTPVMQQYAWSFSLAWQPGYGLHFTTPHMGAPYMGEEDLLNAVYPLVLQATKKSLTLTGAKDRLWWK
jgi:hypothetical protein